MSSRYFPSRQEEAADFSRHKECDRIREASQHVDDPSIVSAVAAISAEQPWLTARAVLSLAGAPELEADSEVLSADKVAELRIRSMYGRTHDAALLDLIGRL